MKKITIAGALKRAFGQLIQSHASKVVNWLSANARPVFCCMVILMLFSGLYVFLPAKTGPLEKISSKTFPVATSATSLGAVSAQLQAVLLLQNRVQVLLAKDSLSHADSLQLITLVSDIQNIQHAKISTP